jgi:hypothetical protein
MRGTATEPDAPASGVNHTGRMYGAVVRLCLNGRKEENQMQVAWSGAAPVIESSENTLLAA